ncbi:hypothetical protein D172_015285 [Pseudoalteromonas sp. Bsw20308]|uniref:oligosaccharide flippase family protein n=1 Tax=Pseudoalteromonas sp. Bsw20308 TaxID=283699 RepID=UPI0002AA926B|nr:oligosaccharide flippase family protein [Pseudoalteromonas sp. Bsw20308]ALQ09300.1 hypothetical protein D172_015285 [Pseudoalteromonas sp. Bsw20308]
MNFLKILRSVALVSGVTGLLNLGVSIAFSFFMTSEQYGLYTYWLSIYLILLNLIPFGAVAAATVFRFNTNLREYKAMLTTSVFLIMPCIMMMVLAFMYIKSLLFTPLFTLGYLAPISAFFYSIVMILVSILRVEQRFKVYSNLFIGFVVLVSILQVCAYYTYNSLEAVIYSHTIGTLIVGTSSLIILIRTFNIKLSLKLYIKSMNNIRELIRYGYPVVFGSVLMSFMVVGDKIILKELVSDKEMGIYSSIVVVCSTTLFLVNNFASAWGGYLVKKLPELKHYDSRAFFLSTQRRVLPVFFILTSIIISTQFLLYLSVYGFMSDSYLYTLIKVSLGYCIYGVSKYYVGFMMYYRNNKEVFTATALGITVMVLCSSFGVASPVDNVSLSVLFGFSFQLLYLVLFVNKRMYGEHKDVL